MKPKKSKNITKHNIVVEVVVLVLVSEERLADVLATYYSHVLCLCFCVLIFSSEIARMWEHQVSRVSVHLQDVHAGQDCWKPHTRHTHHSRQSFLPAPLPPAKQKAKVDILCNSKFIVVIEM